MTIRGVNQQRYDPPWLGQTWVWSQTNFTGLDTLPHNQYDWPNPKVPIWIDESWTVNHTGFLGQDKFYGPAGFAPDFDWPNPKPVTWNNFWSQSLLQTTLKPAPQKPISQYDWPNPVPVLWNQSWINRYNLHGQDKLPNRQQDWPNPTYPWRLDQTWINTVPPGTLNPPFSQLDWPNPQPINWYGNWSSRYTLYGQDQLPNRQQDWPAPQSVQWYQDYRVNLLQTTLTPAPAVLPHNQYDWPTPYLPLSLPFSWTYTSQFIVPAPVIPTFLTGGRQLGPGPESRYQTELRQLATQRHVLEAAATLAKRGGEARAKSLSPSQRSSIASHAASMRWKK